MARSLGVEQQHSDRCEVQGRGGQLTIQPRTAVDGWKNCTLLWLI